MFFLLSDGPTENETKTVEAAPVAVHAAAAGTRMGRKRANEHERLELLSTEHAVTVVGVAVTTPMVDPSLELEACWQGVSKARTRRGAGERIGDGGRMGERETWNGTRMKIGRWKGLVGTMFGGGGRGVTLGWLEKGMGWTKNCASWHGRWVAWWVGEWVGSSTRAAVDVAGFAEIDCDLGCSVN